MRVLLIILLSFLILCGLANAHSSSSSDSHEWGRRNRWGGYWGNNRRVFGYNGWRNNGWGNNGWGNRDWNGGLGKV